MDDNNVKYQNAMVAGEVTKITKTTMELKTGKIVEEKDVTDEYLETDNGGENNE